jgi:hypothetical protein
MLAARAKTIARSRQDAIANFTSIAMPRNFDVAATWALRIVTIVPSPTSSMNASNFPSLTSFLTVSLIFSTQLPAAGRKTSASASTSLATSGNLSSRPMLSSTSTGIAIRAALSSVSVLRLSHAGANRLREESEANATLHRTRVFELRCKNRRCQYCQRYTIHRLTHLYRLPLSYISDSLALHQTEQLRKARKQPLREK